MRILRVPMGAPPMPSDRLDYEDLFQAIPIACHEIDLKGHIARVNAAECALLGFRAEDVVGKHCSEFVAAAERDTSRQAVAEKLSGARPLAAFEREFTRSDGTRLFIEVHEEYIRDKAGRVLGIRTVLFDVTRRCTAERALSEALREAREAAEMKSRFLANVSHEIRTPMNGVLGMTELLLTTRLDTEQLEYTESAKRSAEALLTVINDILDFSKIEAGKLSLQSIPFNLVREVEEVVNLLAVRAHAKGLEMSCEIRSVVPPRVISDPGRIRQILHNLIGNAIKFTDQGEINVLVESMHSDRDDAVVRFSVRDTGIGIPPSQIPRLFRSFEQVDNSSTRQFGGTGLGLAISKQLAELMGGEIGLESQPGKGSTFWFTAVVRRDAQEEIAADQERALFADLKVLVVDDNATNRRICVDLLERWGCRTEQADGAIAALSALHQAAQRGEPFHLGLIDYQMPHMDGAALAQCVKLDPRLRETGLICLTSSTGPTDEDRLRHIGFASHLHKPARQSHLYSTIRKLLQERTAAPSQNGHDTISKTVAAPPVQDGNRRRILVAEDNDINQRVATAFLSKLGFPTQTVADGVAAIQALRTETFDLVLMDLNMPRMDGLAATQEIRRIEGSLKHTPVVAMTANAMTGDRDRCLAAGMDDYISKPIQLAELNRVLERWLHERPQALADC